MGLKEWLGRQAVQRCSVMLVEMPGGWRSRVHAERFVMDRGWQLADSPAGADLLVVCGQLPHDLEDSVEAVWEQLPGPRVRMCLTPDETQQGAAAALEAAVPRLRDTVAQHEDALSRSLPEGMDHEGMDHEGMDHEGMDHEGMDHGGMDMAPDGIPLAEGAEDRDGLEMDELHLTLGPVLRHWPTGLEMVWTLHGDLVTEAEARWFPADDGTPSESHPTSSAVIADAVADLLHLVGWQEAAGRAVRVRNLALGPAGQAEQPEQLRREVEQLVRMVGCSRVLRWSLRGLGRVKDGESDRRQLPSWWEGDAYDRLIGLLYALSTATEATAVGGKAQPTSARPDANHLAALCTGVEVAAARLVVASLAPQLGSLEGIGVPADA